MSDWTHEKLGTFTFDGTEWRREFNLPAFEIFADVSPETLIEFGFEADDEDETPSQEMVAVAELVVANHDRLLTEGVRALLDDLNGQGPDSGMWWHGAIEQVREIARSSDENPVASTDDLIRLLSEPSVTIQRSGYGYDRPCATITFEATFDPEHGIGLLTDGDKILGTGYQMDVSPFE